MDRRRFLLTSLAGAVAAPLAAQAQQAGTLPRVGYLSNSASYDDPDAGFFAGLRELGYEPNRDILVEARYSAGHPGRIAEFAADLVRLKCRLIVAWGPPVVAEITKLTASIPIIAISSTDFVVLGWAATFARPGGNITGFMLDAGELNAKRFELLKEAAPTLTSVALLVNATRPGTEADVAEATRAARALTLKTELFTVSAPEQFERAFALMARHRVDGLVVFPDPMLYGHRTQIVQQAQHHRLPAVYSNRAYVEAGGLLSYSASLKDVARRSASYVDRILKGERPADLPIQRPVKLELAVNMKAAKAIGLTIPPSLLARADQVIE
jgi:putative tryptophan/tyrosine transport system substrate-binding protein